MAEGYVTKDGAHGAEYEHLEKIIDRVISEKPKDAYGLVEVLSRLVRDEADKGTPTTTEDLEAATEYVKKVQVLDKVPSDGEPAAPVNVGSAVPDFCEDAEVLQWAGVGFGELESYKIKCALRNLAFKQMETGYTRIRLWGKMLGTDADYYIAEAYKEGDVGEQDEENPDAEPSGVGANKYTYLVTNDLASQEWTKLPNTKPQDLVASRRIKKLMSGKPSAKVVTHPPFPGTEEVLLRAQIARISADVTLMFKDFLKREGNFGEEDATDPAPNEEFVMPTAAQTMTPQGWQHSEPHILQNGRTTHKEPPEADEDNPDNPDNKVRKRMLAEQESDPLRDPIRQLGGDALSWNFKQFGDDALYSSTSATATGPRSESVTCVRSLTWPGAVTVAKGSNMIQLYVGYGLPDGQPDFFPSLLPDVQEEPEDVDEQIEPQGSPQEEQQEEAEA
jgi:radial spoke head protein 4A